MTFHKSFSIYLPCFVRLLTPLCPLTFLTPHLFPPLSPSSVPVLFFPFSCFSFIVFIPPFGHSLCCNFGILSYLSLFSALHIYSGFTNHGHLALGLHLSATTVLWLNGRLMEGEGDPFSSPDLFPAHPEPPVHLCLHVLLLFPIQHA